MSNSFFSFKQFTIHQESCAMKVTTDSCLFGSWCALQIKKLFVRTSNLLDIGAGTGLLSLMVAQQTEARITAVEIEAEAARQATENVAASPWRHQVQVINGDILLFSPTERFDCIISNPPFYEHSLKAPDASKNRAHHSTALSLAALLPLIRNGLNGAGHFFLLLPFSRRSEIGELVAANDLFIHETIAVRQSPAHGPFRLMIQGSATDKKGLVSTAEILIKDGNGQYSDAFIALLKDYYLYL
jgi:tRNA1Val (adenine37-N6)-methyltransferase